MANPKTRFLLLRIGCVLVAALPLLLSLALHAAEFTPGSNDRAWLGVEFMTCGFMGPCNPTPLFGWYGNPLWLFGAVLVGFGRRPAVAAVGAALFMIGLAVACDSFRLRAVGLAPNEGGVVTHHFAAFGPGFYLWLVSYLVGAIGGVVVTIVGVRMQRTQTTVPAA